MKRLAMRLDTLENFLRVSLDDEEEDEDSAVERSATGATGKNERKHARNSEN
jgi:hypothetical protein